jgi:hypothetical protein
MSERLKEEIELWKHKRCSYDEHGDISATAQHFYNLALDDVKAEVDFLKDKCATVDATELKEFIDKQKME